ncbi:hypothetical protein ACIQVR_37340 [Streptomyces xanthochromogenes]|uniref:hypothetical protein n=1 Tax=Streptomyces xanthochromogenes TaxID=67384 RepID=UPI0037F2D27B
MSLFVRRESVSCLSSTAVALTGLGPTHVMRLCLFELLENLAERRVRALLVVVLGAILLLVA